MIGLPGWLALRPGPSDPPPRKMADFRELCEPPRRYFPTAAAHTGGGPHPMRVFQRANGTVQTKLVDADLRQPVPEQWRPRDPRQVQLVACLDEPADGPVVGECRFTARTIPLHRGLYQVTVYEARTGVRVAEAELTGSTEQRCPSVTLWREGESPRVHTSPDLAEYQRVLGRHVDR